MGHNFSNIFTITADLYIPGLNTDNYDVAIFHYSILYRSLLPHILLKPF
jgi:hypothetical protein